jgi:50S ribosomal protein L16 3-hydroxylase
VPADLQAFAAEGLRRLLAEGDLLGCTLGEVLTEPKPTVWFDEPAAPWTGGGLRLDRRTRMMYDDKHVFINGESFRAGGADARLMRQLADQREIDAQALARASEGARALLAEWVDSGWLLEVAHRA